MTEAEESLVSFQDLSVSYGLVQALSGVSGTIHAGPTGLLGPNGAGKTTLLKTLLGFLSPDRGRMTAFGLTCPARRSFSPLRSAPARAPATAARRGCIPAAAPRRPLRFRP